MKVKVLFVLNHAPDYRESFLSALSNYVDLTVIAGSCEADNLIPPKGRKGYRYLEISHSVFLGAQWPREKYNYDYLSNFDIICCSFNPRSPYWWFMILRYPELRSKWIWWGQIYGRSNLFLFHYVRKFFLPISERILVYSDDIVTRMNTEYGLNAVSFNNTEIGENEFYSGVYLNLNNNSLNLLFVGRNQERKKLSRLMDIIIQHDELKLRLVGKGMSDLEIPHDLIHNGRVEIFSHTTGAALKVHFDWCDLVVNPGHAGLLVMNAARHGKGILIDNESSHAPEVILAKEARQPFVSFSSVEDCKKILEVFRTDRTFLKSLGSNLQSVAKTKYTVENMVQIHVKVFLEIVKKLKNVN